MADVFAIYTPDVPDTAPQPVLRDPLHFFAIVFIISIVFWLPYKKWDRGTFLHDGWIAATVAMYAVHILWLAVANLWWLPSPDQWEYGFIAVVMVITVWLKAGLAKAIPYMIPFICAFYGTQVIFSLGINDPTTMTILLVLLGVACFSTAPVTIYILASRVKEYALTLLDIAFRTIMMVTGVKFLIVQEAERSGTVSCTITRTWHFTDNCPLAISNILIIACIVVFALRVGIEMYIWNTTRRKENNTKEETKPLKHDTDKEEGEEDDDDDDNSSIE